MTEISIWIVPGCPWTFNEDRETPEAFRERLTDSQRLTRLLAAAEAAGGSSAVGRIYDAVGTTIHVEGRQPDDDDVASALDGVGLPRDLAGARDDEAYDAAVRTSHARGQRRVGAESGSPVIAVDDGPGFFGPVVTAAPDAEDAERLLDALVLLSAVPAFSELKRAR